MHMLDSIKATLIEPMGYVENLDALGTGASDQARQLGFQIRLREPVANALGKLSFLIKEVIQKIHEQQSCILGRIGFGGHECSPRG